MVSFDVFPLAGEAGFFVLFLVGAEDGFLAGFFAAFDLVGTSPPPALNSSSSF